MTASKTSEDLVIAQLLDITPSVVPLYTALGRLSRVWDEKEGSIVAFVRENACELSALDQGLAIKSLIGLQAPIIRVQRRDEGNA